MKANKIRKLSISRTGLKIDTLDVDSQTIALYVPDAVKDIEKFKLAYIERMKDRGIKITHQKYIHYKKPFWKIWGMRDYSIAVFKLNVE